MKRWDFADEDDGGRRAWMMLRDAFPDMELLGSVPLAEDLVDPVPKFVAGPMKVYGSWQRVQMMDGSADFRFFVDIEDAGNRFCVMSDKEGMVSVAVDGKTVWTREKGT